MPREVLDEIPYSYCSLFQLVLSYPSFDNYNTTNLPEFQCDNKSSRIWYLNLESFRLTDSSDLSSLETIAKLHNLNMERNHFTRFPNFTNRTKRNLQTLDLSHCEIEEISEEDLEDFTALKNLDIMHNPLQSFPRIIFQVVKLSLQMDFSPVASWDSLRWWNFLCMDVILKRLTLHGAETYKLVLPNLRSVFCHHTLNITFKKVS